MSFEVTVTPTVYNVEVEVNPSVQPFDVVVEVGNVPDLDLTTNGDSGASTFDPLTGDLNIPEYTLDGLGGVPETRTITINGTTQDLSADRTFTIPAPDPVTIGSPANGLAIDGSQVLTIGLASSSTNGALSSTDWTTFNGKQNALGFTAENVANKAINLTSPDDTKYPTTLAVSTALAGKQDTLTNPITGTGVSGQVAFWSGTGSQTGDNGLTWDNTNKRFAVTSTTDGDSFKINGTKNRSLVLNTDTGNRTFLTVFGNLSSPNFDGGAYFTAHGFQEAWFNVISNQASVGNRYWRFGNKGDQNYFAIQKLNDAATVVVSTALTIFSSNSNIGINTTTDAGFRLDVNGTARVQGELTVNTVQIGLGGGAIASNTRVGVGPLNANTTGSNNVAVGFGCMQSNSTGAGNVAAGRFALQASNSSNNTAIGINSLFNQTSGSSNTAIGASSLFEILTGANAVGVGPSAGRRQSDGNALTIASNSIFIGADSRANANNQTNQIVIGHEAIGLGSNTTVIGNSSTTFGRWWGNLLIGTSTNAGFGLDVNGTARVQGNLTVGTQTASAFVHIAAQGSLITDNVFRIRNSANTFDIIKALGDGTVSIGIGAGNINSGSNNIFFGGNAGRDTTTGINNVFIGFQAGRFNTTGTINVFVGPEAGLNSLTTTGNSFFGNASGRNNTTGNENSGFGFNAGRENTTGTQNAFFGVSAGRFIADGTTANTITNNSVFLGAQTRANADNQTNQIVIGHTAIGLGSNTTVIGNSSTTFGRWWGNLLIGTSTNSTFALDVNGTARVEGSITTGAPTGGTAKPFKIGAVATVTPTLQNRTIEIEIEGTTYYLTAKTTND